MMRRVAAHELLIDGQMLRQAMVEIAEGRVVNYYTFDRELPMTEWLGGTIEVRRSEEGVLEAYHQGRRLL